MSKESTLHPSYRIIDAIFNRLNLRLSEKGGLDKHSYLKYALEKKAYYSQKDVLKETAIQLLSFMSGTKISFLWLWPWVGALSQKRTIWENMVLMGRFFRHDFGPFLKLLLIKLFVYLNCISNSSKNLFHIIFAIFEQ